MIGGGLKPGDILLTGGQGRIFSKILWATTIPGEKPSRVGHVGLVDTGGTLLNSYCIEATMGRVKPRRLYDRYYGSSTAVAFARPVNLTQPQLREVLTTSRSMVGRKYGQGKIVLQLADALLAKVARRDVFAFRRLALADRWPICSWHVAKAFDAAGLDFGVDWRGATPDDIDDYVSAHKGSYIWVYGPVMKTLKEWLAADEWLSSQPLDTLALAT